MGSNLTRLPRSMSFVDTKPVVFILGSTGVGKSKLALDIATRLNGEVISVDSMQVYKGLDIATNKVTEEERLQCRHHLIDCVPPTEEFTVIQFQKETLRLIDELHKRNKLPVLAGGTSYYAVSILWDYLVRTTGTETTWQTNDQRRKELEAMSCDQLYKMLSEADPRAALQVHNQNKRKIIRHLEVFEQTGESLLDMWDKQRAQDGSSANGGPIRFPNACVLWLQCDKDVLLERIRKRTTTMLEQGLLQELKDFHLEFNHSRLQENIEPDYEHGIFQNIGLKEFHGYLTAPLETSDEAKEKLFEQAIFRMNERSFQYAKKQNKEIRSRIVDRSNALPVYALDTTHVEKWDDKVRDPAFRIIRSVYKDSSDIVSKLRDVRDSTLVEPVPQRNRTPSNTHFVCDLCDGRMIADHDWKVHLQSKKHLHFYYKRKRELAGTSRILTARVHQLAEEDDDFPSKAADESSISSDDGPFILFEDLTEKRTEAKARDII